MEVISKIQGQGDVWFSFPLIDSTNRPSYKSGVASATIINNSKIWYRDPITDTFKFIGINNALEIGNTGIYSGWFARANLNPVNVDIDLLHPLVIEINATGCDKQTVIIRNPEARDSNLLSINGDSVSDGNAKLSLSQLSIVNSDSGLSALVLGSTNGGDTCQIFNPTDDAMSVEAPININSGTRTALNINTNSSMSAVTITNGTGDAVEINASLGEALKLIGKTIGLDIQGSDTEAVKLLSANGIGIKIDGKTIGIGVGSGYGGASNGTAIQVSGGSGNSTGVSVNGGDIGTKITGGNEAMQLANSQKPVTVDVATSTDAIKAFNIDGNGLTLEGTNGKDISAKEIDNVAQSTDLTSIESTVSDTNTKISTPNNYKADISGLAQESTVNANKSEILTDANENTTAIITSESDHYGALQTHLTDQDSDIGTILAKLPTGNISDFSTSNTIDGVSVYKIFEYCMAMFNGRYKVNEPNDGSLTFYKRDNTTPLTVVNIENEQRTRES